MDQTAPSPRRESFASVLPPVSAAELRALPVLVRLLILFIRSIFARLDRLALRLQEAPLPQPASQPAPRPAAKQPRKRHYASRPRASVRPRAVAPVAMAAPRAVFYPPTPPESRAPAPPPLAPTFRKNAPTRPHLCTP